MQETNFAKLFVIMDHSQTTAGETTKKNYEIHFTGSGEAKRCPRWHPANENKNINITAILQIILWWTFSLEVGYRLLAVKPQKYFIILTLVVKTVVSRPQATVLTIVSFSSTIDLKGN